MLASVQGGLTGPSIQRFGERQVVTASLALGVLSYSLVSQAVTGWMIYAGVILGGFAGMAFPTLQAMMSRAAPADAQGELQGAVTSAYSLSAMVGPFLMTQLFSAYADETGVYAPGAPFLASASLILTALVVFYFHTRRRPELTGPVDNS